MHTAHLLAVSRSIGGGVSAWECLPGGGMPAQGGVSDQGRGGVYPSMQWVRHPLCEQNHRQV